MRRRHTRASVVRAAAVVALALLASGAPQFVLAAVGGEVDCSSDCAGSVGGKQCPPTCTSGSCAKTVVTVVPSLVEAPVPPGEPTPLCSDASEQLSSGIVQGVFHPPKA